MKECPICKESFQDDLNFCDLDGSPLDGGTGNAVVGSSSKLWSFLGIALLLAAVGITAGAIIFFPRGPSATLPSSRSQSGPSAPASTQPAAATDSGQTQADASTGLDRAAVKSGSSDEAVGTSPDQARLASRRTALSKNDNSDPSLPDPKAVVGSDDDLTRTARQPNDATRPRTSTSTSAADSASSARIAPGESSGSDSTAKSPAASAAARHRSKTQAQGDDAAGGSKKDDKKKGGFLRVFKKIFGHG